MRILLCLAWVWFLASCGSARELEQARVIGVAPSALGQLPAITEAVEALNAWGADFELRVNSSEDARALQVVIREDASVEEPVRGQPGFVRGGRAVQEAKGWVVLLMRGAPSRLVAHEIGHAAGLRHVDDPWNLMCPVVQDGWELTEQQVRELRW